MNTQLDMNMLNEYEDQKQLQHSSAKSISGSNE